MCSLNNHAGSKKKAFINTFYEDYSIFSSINQSFNQDKDVTCLAQGAISNSFNFPIILLSKLVKRKIRNGYTVIS